MRDELHDYKQNNVGRLHVTQQQRGLYCNTRDNEAGVGTGEYILRPTTICHDAVYSEYIRLIQLLYVFEVSIAYIQDNKRLRMSASTTHNRPQQHSLYSADFHELRANRAMALPDGRLLQ
jgi:hypothetical protein